MSMAQRQRITDESSVQIPKVRAWRPFTVEQKKTKSVERGRVRLPPNSSHRTGGSWEAGCWARTPFGWAEGRLWCYRGALEGMEGIPEWELLSSASYVYSCVGSFESRNPSKGPLRQWLLNVVVYTSAWEATLVLVKFSKSRSAQICGNVAHSGLSIQSI